MIIHVGKKNQVIHPQSEQYNTVVNLDATKMASQRLKGKDTLLQSFLVPEYKNHELLNRVEVYKYNTEIERKE